MRFSIASVSALILAVVLVWTTPARAAVITLTTGGRGTTGFNPWPVSYAAVDFYKNGGQTNPLSVQNVGFDTNASAITGPAGGSTGTTPVSSLTGSPTNDANLETVGKNVLYGSTLTITVSGLTSGVNYQFDLFASAYGLGGSGHRESINYLTSANAVITTEPAFVVSTTANAIYDAVNAITAPSDGIVKVQVVDAANGTFTDPNAVVGALSITTPEPASLTLLGLGGLMILRRRR